MKIRLIYWLMGVALLLIFVVYLVLPKDSVRDEFGMVGSAEQMAIVVGQEEREVIREIISTLAHTQLAALPFKKGRMEALGKRLNGKVNTFEFLAVIFTEPDLIADMKLLQKSTFKYKKFSEGLHPKLLKDYQKEGFYRRAQLFAKHLGLDTKEFMPLLNDCLESAKGGDKLAFLPLLDYLINL